LFFVNSLAGERPYTCPGCPKLFARCSALRIHKISVHQNVKSFLCPECGSAFKANSALIDHRKRVHLQLKPHQCEYCKKDFFSKKDYSEHIRTHTGEKPFQCQVNYNCVNIIDCLHLFPPNTLQMFLKCLGFFFFFFGYGTCLHAVAWDM
jgi:uncharacterized Zn-finger protein